MPTATRPGRRPPARPGRRAPAQNRYARAASHRGQGLRRRKPPEKSGLKKVLSAVLPGAAAKKAAPSSKKGKAGGLALAAAAAGMAFKNREKLGQLRHKDDAGTTGTPATNSNYVAPQPPTTPSV
jgi:hypothetical protein